MNTRDNAVDGLGKLPPQAIDLEEAVLAAIMLEGNSLALVADFLKPECFYKDANKEIYSAIVELNKKSEPIDILTVADQLKKSGKIEEAGGVYRISEITSSIYSSANIESHARIVVEKYIKRELIKIASNIHIRSYDDTYDPFDLMDEIENDLFSMTRQTTKKDIQHISFPGNEFFEELQRISSKKTELTGVPSGILTLDRKTCGWQNSDLIIIAARPGMGKTSLMLSCARNAAVEFDRPGAIFSLEMSKKQLIARLCASETGISVEKFRNAKLEDYEWSLIFNKTSKLMSAPIFIDDTPGITVFELKSKIKRLMMKQPIKWVMIDYLQLMSGSNKHGTREGEISEISRNLKGLAKELDIPIIALSQLSRAVETRGGDKKPNLSDLRESGAIEQDADLVIFIYRPEYYGINQFEDGTSTSGVAILIFAKFRNGSPGEIEISFIHKLTKFAEPEPYFNGQNNGAINFSEPNKDRNFDEPPY